MGLFGYSLNEAYSDGRLILGQNSSKAILMFIA